MSLKGRSGSGERGLVTEKGLVLTECHGCAANPTRDPPFTVYANSPLILVDNTPSWENTSEPSNASSSSLLPLNSLPIGRNTMKASAGFNRGPIDRVFHLVWLWRDRCSG